MDPRESLPIFWNHENNHTGGLRYERWTKVCSSSLCLLQLLLESWGEAGYFAVADTPLAEMLGTSVHYGSLLGAFLLRKFLLQQSLSYIEIWVATQPQEGNLIFHSACNKTTHTCPGLVIEKRQVVILCVLSQDLWLTRLFPLWEWDLNQSRTCWENPEEF